MTFSSMVIFMVKWALAAIPALLILIVIGGIILLIFGALFSAIIGSLLNALY